MVYAHTILLWAGLLLCSPALWAQWQCLPAGKPEVTAFAADAAGQRIILGARDAGVWLSNDGGMNWTPIGQRVADNARFNVFSFDMADAGGDTILADIRTRWFADTLTRRCFSLDGGETWAGTYPLRIPANYSTWYYPFVGLQAWRAHPEVWLDMTGWFCRSTDQGQTWDTLGTTPVGSRSHFYQDPFEDSTLYYTVGPSVFQSTDLGMTWDAAINFFSGPYSYGGVHDLIRLSNHHLAVICELGEGEYAQFGWVLLGDPDGSHFDTAAGLSPYLFPEQMLEDRTSPGTLIVGASCDGGLLRSVDFGLTWQNSLPGLPPGRQFGTWLYQNPHGGALYAGISGFGVYRSSDHGATWQAVMMPPIGTPAGWFSVREEGVYYQYRQTYLEAPYFGQTLHQWGWEPSSNAWQYLTGIPARPDSMIKLGPVLRKNGDSLLCYAAFVQHEDRWGVPSTGHMARSGDNGRTWTFGPAMENPLDPIFLVVTEQNGVTRIFGRGLYLFSNPTLRAKLFMSDNWGETWSDLGLLAENSIPLALAQNGDTLYQANGLQGMGGSLWRSTNVGQTWESLRSLGDAICPEPVLVGNDVYVAVGDNLWRFTQGVWEDRGPLPPDPDPFYHYCVIGITTERPLLIAYFQDLYVSADSGHSWQPRQIELPFENRNLYSTSLKWDPFRGRLWGVTSAGACYVDTFNLSSKDEPLVFKPADYTMLSCYPNPFNPTTTIRFDLLKQERVKLDVYDVQGRLVRTLCDEVRNAGRNELRFEGDGLASGVYFVRLNSSAQTRTEKILLLK